MKGDHCSRWGVVPCMAQELSLQVEALEREWLSAPEEDEDEYDSEEVIYSVGRLDMAALSSVITSGVGNSGALASVRGATERETAFRYRSSSDATATQPAPASDLPVSKLAPLTGKVSEAATEAGLPTSWEPALRNWRAVQAGQAPTAPGAWRGCRKGPACNRESRHRGVCNTRASPPSLAWFSDHQLAAAGISAQELALLAAAKQEEQAEEPTAARSPFSGGGGGGASPTDADGGALQAAGRVAAVVQREVAFPLFEADDSDGSEYTGQAPLLGAADSDIHFEEGGLEGVAGVLAVGALSQPRAAHTPLGIHALRARFSDDVSSVRTQAYSLTSTPTFPPHAAPVPLSPAPGAALASAGAVPPVGEAPTRNSRRLQAKASSRARRSPSPEGDDALPAVRTSRRLAAAPGEGAASRASSPVSPVLAPATTATAAAAAGPQEAQAAAAAGGAGTTEMSFPRPRIVLGNRNRKRGANGTLKSTFSSIAPAAPGQHCMHCGTNVTPVWRAGPDGPKTLCNACGVRWMKVKPRRL